MKTNLATEIIEFLEGTTELSDSTASRARFQEPVSAREFMTTKYYASSLAANIYPFWIEQAIDFIESGANELIITGSLGAGKTTVANLILLYKFYELLCWKYPNKFLGLPDLQTVFNIYFSVTAQQARRTGYGQFRSMIDGSEWFQRYFKRRPSIDSVIDLCDGKFQMIAGSSPSDAIGMTVWATILDEADFFKKGGQSADDAYERVTEMYQELADRRTSRFRKFGKDLSFSILISSASFQSSFVSKRIEASKDNPNIKVVRAVGYKIKPEGTYSKETFPVFTGHAMSDPEIIDSVPALANLLPKLRIETPPQLENCLTVHDALRMVDVSTRNLFEMVPIDFYEDFKRNIHKSLMNHSGLTTARVGRLFQSKHLLLSAYDPDLRHPFTKQEIEVSTEDNIQIKDYFLLGMLDHIDRPHAIHVDQSLSGDSTGISMVRYDGVEERNGIRYRQYCQVFSLRINPPHPPGQIQLSKIREFILMLSEAGVNLYKVTFDSFNSADSMQLLTERGVNAAYQSLDKTDKAYLMWLELLQDRCIRMYPYESLQREALDAVHDRGKCKVDHPKYSSIDVLQSFAGALFNLANANFDGEYFVETEEQQTFTARSRSARPIELNEFFEQVTSRRDRDDYENAIFE